MRDKAKLNGLALNNKCLDKDCCMEDLIETGRVDYIGMRQLHNHMQPQLSQDSQHLYYSSTKAMHKQDTAT